MNESETATRESGPLASLLKAQEETNTLLKTYLAKEGGEMEQTSQTAPKKVGDKNWVAGRDEIVNADEKPGDAKDDKEPDKDEDDDKKKKEKEAEEYPYPTDEKAMKKAFPFPYGQIASKREEIVAKQLDNANTEIERLNKMLSKMIPPTKLKKW
jgi:hypothetical protein